MGLSAKITVFLISQKIISAKDRDVYEYGFDFTDWHTMEPAERNRNIPDYFCWVKKCMWWISCKNPLQMSYMYNRSIYLFSISAIYFTRPYNHVFAR